MYMYMMFHVDDWCWFMLDLSLNEVTMKYMPCNLDIYAKSIIYVEYNLMNIWTWWWTPAVHVWYVMIIMLYVGLFKCFRMILMLDDDISWYWWVIAC